MKELVMFLLVIPAAILSGAWTFMLTVGVIRGEWLHNLPTLGYRDSVVITATAFAALVLKLLWAEVAKAVRKA